MKKKLLTTFDHIIFGAYSLDEGVDFIYQKLGVMPQQGGKHALMGTHNKLLKIGRSIYLEIIAIDPDAPKPSRPRWFGLDDLQPDARPKLLTWVVRTNDIHEAVKKSGLKHGTIESFHRGIYKWFITVAADGAMLLQGIAPTIIQWRGIHHPAKDLPDSKVSLVNIEAFHPEATLLNDSLNAMNYRGKFLAEPIQSNSKPLLRVTLNGPTGSAIFE
ncbi:MAG TPA: VOC family protein [Parafilimonas sp.]|nr:VOC family protein [Parafilimonas sp.]